MKKLLFISILIFSTSSCGIVCKKKKKSDGETSTAKIQKEGKEAPYHYRDKQEEAIKERKTREKKNNDSPTEEEGVK